jgi:hypothetical protein
MMRNTRRYHKTSQIPFYHEFLVIYDKIEWSWINRFFVVSEEIT